MAATGTTTMNTTATGARRTPGTAWRRSSALLALLLTSCAALPPMPPPPASHPASPDAEEAPRDAPSQTIGPPRVHAHKMGDPR